jgi:hypothetical protein
MVMIPMECPKCGRRGSVPSNRLNTPFNCKSCNAPFYLNMKGDAVLGEPMVVADKSARGKRAATKEKTELDLSAIKDLFSGWRDMSSGDRIRKLSAVGVCLALIAGLYHYFTMDRTDPLVERGEYVAKAFADNDEVRVRAAAAVGTEEDAAIWLEKTRTMIGMKGRSGDFTVSTGIMSGSKKEGGAELLATYVPLNPSAVQAPAADTKGGSSAESQAQRSQMLTVNIFFMVNPAGQWRLDGARSLSSTTTQQKAQSKLGRPR